MAGKPAKLPPNLKELAAEARTPIQHPRSDEYWRYRFAEKALEGLLIRERLEPRFHRCADDETVGAVYARAACAYADSLLAELKRTEAKQNTA